MEKSIKNTLLKKSDILFGNNKSWYDITVLIVILGLYYTKHDLKNERIVAFANISEYKKIDFSLFLPTLQNYNISVVINTNQTHYTALYLFKINGNNKNGFYNDSYGTETPDYIIKSCQKIGYTIVNKKIRLQATRDNYNCGPLTIYTLCQFAQKKKIKNF